jgi:hypothetical protein
MRRGLSYRSDLVNVLLWSLGMALVPILKGISVPLSGDTLDDEAFQGEHTCTSPPMMHPPPEAVPLIYKVILLRLMMVSGPKEPLQSIFHAQKPTLKALQKMIKSRFCLLFRLGTPVCSCTSSSWSWPPSSSWTCSSWSTYQPADGENPTTNKFPTTKCNRRVIYKQNIYTRTPVGGGGNVTSKRVDRGNPISFQI